MLKNKDSLANTIIVATGVCLVCSLLVSAAAVGLRSLQQKNVLEDRKKNILLVAGMDLKEIKAQGGIEKVFSEKIVPEVINLQTGKADPEGLLAALKAAGRTEFNQVEDLYSKYDAIGMAKNAKASDTSLVKSYASDPANKPGFGSLRENYAIVFKLKDDSGNFSKFILPVRGKGLWSILKGYLAVDRDLQTVAGITFYEDAETPGLGGEINNPNWKKSWVGKQLFDDGAVVLRVVKGQALDNTGIDGLSGATITGNGVTEMVHFWLGAEGFGKYFENLKTSGAIARREN
jgi:Na+-transporting NADH:ubiquinone oxidoreductase subunit C